MTQDMTGVIAPKSDQLNSEDFISGPRTVTIREVSIRPGTEQPVSIFYDGDNGKPWKPCKTTARILVAAWGPDAKEYTGRSATLYRDPSVKWGGLEVGGIRISHLSHIERDMVLALSISKGNRKPYTIKPLKDAPKQHPTPTVHQWAAELTSALPEMTDTDTIKARWAERSKELGAADRELFEAVKQAVVERCGEVSNSPVDADKSSG